MPPQSKTPTGLCACLAVLALWPFVPAPAAAADRIGRVDTAIVFAVDTSSSIDPAEADLQRRGHVEALRSREVEAAIRRGLSGCIAVTYVEWSSAGRLNGVLPWTKLCGRGDVDRAAAAILERGDSGLDRRARGRTSLSYALEASSLLLDAFPGEADSKIIDISANGTNNDGLPVAGARARVLEKGHVINAIALSRAEPGVADDLWSYFHHNVIGGPGSFAIVPDHPSDYVKAIRRKLVLEISRARGPAGALTGMAWTPDRRS